MENRVRPKIEDQKFKGELRDSHQVCCMVAAWLSVHGLEAKVKTMRVTPDHESRRAYKDDGDISTPDGRIEVKYWPHINFTSADDMPYRLVFVDEVYQLEREHTEPLLGYIICNAKITHAAFIPATTSHLWRKVRKHDSRYGTELEWYAIPRERVSYRQIGAVDDG